MGAVITYNINKNTQIRKKIFARHHILMGTTQNINTRHVSWIKRESRGPCSELLEILRCHKKPETEMKK
jgi:hypothetical protein